MSQNVDTTPIGDRYNCCMVRLHKSKLLQLEMKKPGRQSSFLLRNVSKQKIEKKFLTIKHNACLFDKSYL